MVQHIRPINKQGPQEILDIQRREDELKDAKKKSRGIYSPQEDYYTIGEDLPTTSVVGDI